MDAYSLMYHDVIRPEVTGPSGFDGPDAASYKLDVRLFERHLTAISEAADRAGLERVIRPRELAWRTPTHRPAVLLHFDDGGACALDIADRLERTGWRGYFHITTDRIGTRGFVTIDDLRELHARGHVIGTHSCSHPARMSSLSWDVLVREWTASKARLDDLLGQPVVVASVPGGYCSRAVILAADQAGIDVLFTSEPTSRFEWIRGCTVLGRYTMRSTTAAEHAARIAVGAAMPCWEQWATWNAKKVIKRVGGERWLAMRKQLFGWYDQRAGLRRSSIDALHGDAGERREAG
ncbi:MAG: polysaccharide deacetylase family protein [Kofleriaceae bacterium]